MWKLCSRWKTIQRLSAMTNEETATTAVKLPKWKFLLLLLPLRSGGVFLVSLARSRQDDGLCAVSRMLLVLKTVARGIAFAKSENICNSIIHIVSICVYSLCMNYLYFSVVVIIIVVVCRGWRRLLLQKSSLFGSTTEFSTSQPASLSRIINFTAL